MSFTVKDAGYGNVTFVSQSTSNGQVMIHTLGDPNGTSYGSVYPVVSSTFEATHVLKASQGYLLNLTVMTGNTSGYVLLVDSTTSPANGSILPIWFAPVSSNGTTGFLSASWGNAPLKYNNGLVACFSTTGPFTYTPSNTAAFSAQIQ